MSDLSSEQLAAMSEDQLYAQLGAIQIASKHAMLSTLSLQNEALTFVGADASNTGKSFFSNLNQTAYDFFCGSGANPDSLSHLLAALGISKDTGTIISAVAGVLGASLGWGSLIAGIVAALLVKVVFPAGYSTLCADWKAKLSS